MSRSDDAVDVYLADLYRKSHNTFAARLPIDQGLAAIVGPAGPGRTPAEPVAFRRGRARAFLRRVVVGPLIRLVCRLAVPRAAVTEVRLHTADARVEQIATTIDVVRRRIITLISPDPMALGEAQVALIRLRVHLLDRTLTKNYAADLLTRAEGAIAGAPVSEPTDPFTRHKPAMTFFGFLRAVVAEPSNQLQVVDALRQLRTDIIRLFDDSDEFAGSTASR